MSKRAFTLIELLVVIAIIAILAAILFPVFAQAKAAAKKTADLSNTKQMATAHLIYTNDTDDMALSFPYAGRWSVPSYTNRELGPFWTDRLMPYMKNRQIFANPGNSDTLYDTQGYWRPGALSAVDTNTNNFYRVTTTFNHLISRGDMPPPNVTVNPPTDPTGASSMTAVDRPAEVTILGPSQNYFSFSTCVPGRDGGTSVDYAWTISVGGWGYELYGARTAAAIPVNGGFGGGANFGYVDGHSKYAKAVQSPANVIALNGDASLYAGYFPQAVNRFNVSTDGTCPGDRKTRVY